MRSLVPLGLAGAGGAALAGYLAKRQKRYHSHVSVISWNLLATPFTMYEALSHRNPAGKIAKPGGLETDEQSYSRYSRAGAALLEKNSHVVMLQECEPAFFTSSRNQHAEALLKKYQLFQCFAWQTDGSIEPATAILLRRDAVKALEAVPRCVGGNNSTGGNSKVVTVVDTKIQDAEYTFASGHFTWDGDAAKREHHVKLLEPLLAQKKNFVLGGDFNADFTSLAEMQKNTWLKDTNRVPLDPCSGTFKNMPKGGVNETLDHFFASKALSIVKAFAWHAPICPYGEGSPAEVVSASDHVAIEMEIRGGS